MSYAIGIDVGGTKVLGGVVDENGKIHATARKDTPRQGGAALTQLLKNKEILNNQRTLNFSSLNI